MKLEARYGENIADVLAISGFAVRSITDASTGSQSYTPLTSMTVWGEIHTNGKVQFGVFGGVFKNLGTKEEMLAGGSIYGLGTDIDALIRVSPRIVFNSNKTRIALEMEYTQAAYGNNFDVSYTPETTTDVSNLRGLVAIYYFF